MICEHCGGNRWKAGDYDRLLQDRDRWQKEAQRAVAREAVSQQQLRLAQLEKKDHEASLQRKVSRQSKQIRRLEERLKQVGTPPYEQQDVVEVQLGGP